MRAEAKTPSASPALAVPAPPTRTLVPVSAEPEPVAPPANPPAPVNTPVRNAEAPPPTRVPPPASPPPASPPPTPVVESPPPVLQTAPDVSGLELKVKETLGEVEGLLKKVKPEALSREAKDHYNNALSHIRTARDAAGYRNFIYAQQLAEKALALAKQLVKS
jgi:hypothetical protein